MYRKLLTLYFFIPLIFSFQNVFAQTCPITSGISTTTFSSNSSIISWVENGSSTNWDLEVILEGTTPTGIPTPEYDDISTNPATITGLLPETAYEVFVRSDCGMDNVTDVSGWSISFSFTTLCAPLSTNYNQPFSQLDEDDLAQCWTMAASGIPDETGPMDLGDGSWREDGFSNIGGEGAMRIRLNSDSDADWLISPIVNIPTTGIQADFDLAITGANNSNAAILGSDDELQFLLSTDAGATWIALQTWTQADNVDPAGENKVYDLSEYSGMDLIFAFWAFEGTVDDEESTDVFIDNFSVRVPPTCFAPSAPSISEIGSVSATVSWTPSPDGETAWDIEVVENGGPFLGIPTMGSDDITTTSTMIIDLSPETSYEVYIRSDCGMDNTTDVSTWLGPISFATGCGAFETPYFEDFFNTPGPFGGFPNCWTEANDGNLVDGPSNFGSSSWGVRDQFGNFGDKSMRINLFQSGDVDWLFTPSFVLEENQEYLAEFDLSATNFLTTDPTSLGSDDRFVFLISSDNGASWTPLQFWTAEDMIDPAGDRIVHDVSTFAGGEVKFAFWASEGEIDDPEDYEIFIDNFFVRNPPSCLEISDVMIDDIQPSSANISWSENGTATAWDIELVIANTPSTGIPTTELDDISNPTVIDGLTPDTEYEIYVRSDCGMDNSSDLSIWVGPFSFRTPCNIDAPYLEDFTLEIIPDCWNTLSGGDPSTGPLDDSPSNWISGFQPGALDLVFPGFFDVNDWIISPPINLNGGAYQAEFDLSVLNAADGSVVGTLGSDDRIMILVSTDFMESWTTLELWTSGTVFDGLVLNITHDLSAFADLSPIFAIWTTQGIIQDPEQNRVVLDRFEITELDVLPIAATTSETDVSCNGFSDGAIDLNVTGGQIPLSYMWSNGSSDEDISNLPAGDYTVTVTSSDGTDIELTATVSEPTAIELSTNVMDETADGAADGSIDLTVSGGTAGYTFSWDNGATTEDLSDLEDGTYCVTITDVNNCIQTTCAEVIPGLVSVQDLSDLTSFRAYPNPVGNQQFIIDLEFSLDKDLEIQIINIFGQEVYKTEHLKVSDLEIKVDAARFPTGIYFIKLTDLKVQQTMTHRLIKQ